MNARPQTWKSRKGATLRGFKVAYFSSARWGWTSRDHHGWKSVHAILGPDDIGTDGQVHADVADPRIPGTLRHACACGFRTDDTPEFDDHLLMAFVPADNIGSDGDKRVPVGTATPIRWYVRKVIDD